MNKSKKIPKFLHFVLKMTEFERGPTDIELDNKIALSRYVIKRLWPDIKYIFWKKVGRIFKYQWWNIFRFFMLVACIFLGVYYTLIDPVWVDKTVIINDTTVVDNNNYKVKNFTFQKYPAEYHNLNWNNVLFFLNEFEIKDFDFVIKQIQIESGLKSNLVQINNNLCGMRYPKSRPTVASKELNGFAYYDHWILCLYDYKLWQSVSPRKKGESLESYYTRRSYATGPDYVKHVLSVRVNVELQ